MMGFHDAMWGAGEGFLLLPFCARTAGKAFHLLYFRWLQAKKKYHGISRLGQITALLFISHLLIHKETGVKTVFGRSAIHAWWCDAEPFSHVLRIKMKPYYLFCPLDSIISMEHQFISLCAVCGSHIWDFNNLHAVL